MKFVLILVSLVLVTSAIICSYRIGLKANIYEHELGHVTDAMNVVSGEIGKLEAKHR